jgi:hypothetical protein
LAGPLVIFLDGKKLFIWLSSQKNCFNWLSKKNFSCHFFWVKAIEHLLMLLRGKGIKGSAGEKERNQHFMVAAEQDLSASLLTLRIES